MTKNKTYSEEYEEMFDEFLKSTSGENILQMVLRTHLYIEHALETIIEDSFVKPQLVLKRSSFANKLSLVAAIGIIPDGFYNLMRDFNKIRNNYAHDLKFELTEKHLDELINKFDDVASDGYKIFKEYLSRITVKEENIFNANTKIVMATLLTSVKRHHILYVRKSLDSDMNNLNELVDILNKKNESEIRAYLTEIYDDIIRRLSQFSKIHEE